MLLQLRLRERKSSPPNFLQLLGEIREEEEHEAARHKLSARRSHVKTVQVDTTTGDEPSEISRLQAELKEVKLMVTHLTSAELSSPTALVNSARVAKKSSKAEQNSEVEALRKQVQDLKIQLNAVLVKQPNTQEVSQTTSKEVSSTSSKTVRRSSSQESDTFFCYRCGEDGHIATKCISPENSNKVIQKLLQALRRAKEARKVSPQGNVTEHCNVRTSTVEPVKPNLHIPKGLVGPSSTIDVKVCGHSCKALLDTVSQVTIIFESWHSKYLSNVPIQPVTGLVIWGLIEASYPYKGYIVVELEFSEKLGVSGSLSVLALVCPEPHSPDHVPIIIGTNANLFKRLADLCTTQSSDASVSSLRIQPLILQAQQQKQKAEMIKWTDESIGQVKWLGPGSLNIDPRKECLVSCKVEQQRSLSREMLLVETPTSLTLPAGVLLPSFVLPASQMDVNGLPVLLQNDTLKPVSLPEGTVLAHIYATDIVTVVQQSDTQPDALDPSLFSFGESPMSESWKKRLSQKLAEKRNVFSLNEWDVGLAKGVEHHIRLSDPRPFRERSRRLAPADIDDVRRHLQELLAAGIIKESRSPYASPIVIARKKNGSVRMCVDYRTLNNRTIPDQYTMPRIDDALDCLSGSKWFSVLDLRGGYYQIEMAEEDKEKTAFICPLGFFQFQRMPQGITGAPATFQRLMEKAVGDINLLQVVVYLDDIIVFGKTLEEHEERLLKVLDRLEEVGLKISIDKCQFCQPKVKYVGHIVSEAGIATDPKKVELVKQWKQPMH
ncbi:uncharacterized protein [Paramisgurnus dabryanus]|uniref:uncharacterized protein n=1 Tax=Paramisgurnus dabryanus TaxID=90735 RepID=UPI0031F3F0C7